MTIRIIPLQFCNKIILLTINRTFDTANLVLNLFPSPVLNGSYFHLFIFVLFRIILEISYNMWMRCKSEGTQQSWYLYYVSFLVNLTHATMIICLTTLFLKKQFNSEILIYLLTIETWCNINTMPGTLSPTVLR
jgi:hypothetical protein